MMTAGSTMLGLLPILWATATGASVMKRIAAPMIGGMITAPLLSMFVLPAVYLLMRKPRRAKHGRIFSPATLEGEAR